jgi:hypothetical protein
MEWRMKAEQHDDWLSSVVKPETRGFKNPEHPDDTV